MRKIFTIFLITIGLYCFAQPVEETILTQNFTDPYDIKSMDFDNNSHDDIIVCGVGGISWFSNDGSDFTTINILDSMAVVNDMALVDFDSDTDIDIVGINSASGSVFRLENDGSMNFTYQLITDTISSLTKMYADDLDDDGDIDILFSVYDGGFYNIHLLNNTGSGFTNTRVDRVDFSRDIFAFDYDNDGDIDFLTKTNYYPFTTEELAIMVNDGNNTFTETLIYEKTGDINVTHAYFTNLDKTGGTDLIISDNVQDEIYWLEDCTVRHNILSSEHVTEATVADFNNDGINDILYKYENSTTYDFYILQGNNPGPSMSFTEVWNLDPDVSTRGLIPLNADTDDLPEFTYTSAARDEIGVFNNSGGFEFELKKLATSASQPECLRRADLDSDGDMDIISFGSEEELIWFDLQPDGTYINKIITSELDNPCQLEVDDIDEDGDMDIITTSIGDSDFSIWYNDGNEIFTEFYLTSSSSQVSNPSFFSIADLDNDNDKDFVIVGSSVSSYYPKGIFWIRNEGSGTFSSPITIEDGLNMMGEVITHDFDNDGNIDIIVADGAYGSEGLMVIKNNASADSFTITQPLSFKAETIRLGDVDGDGLMDFVCRNDGDNDIVWCKSNGDLTFTVNTIPMSESRDVRVELCDEGNDGDTDIFFYTNYYGFTNSSDFTAGILINDGDENFALSYYLQNYRNMLGAVATDTDNDSDIDFFLGVDYDDKVSYFENLIIDLTDPIITSWPTASDITYEETLSGSVLTGGTASVPGTFSFANPDFIPNAGIYTAQIKFTPDDPSTYSTMVGTADLTVYKATPDISTWPTASDIEYGQTLGTSVLSGGISSTTGTFTFDNPSNTPGLGIYTANITFTADAADNYFTVSGTVDVNIIPATPAITEWPTASDITYGETLSASSLTGGTADVPGTFSFDSPGTAPDAGTYTADVTFTPDDAANYNSTSGTADVIVNMANPNVSLWPTASDITYGETLSASSLTGGTADVPGTFAFDSPGTTPNAGTFTADLTFTPDDTANYNSTSGTVDVIVNMANPNVSLWPTASGITYGETLSASSLTGGTADVPGTFSFDSPGTAPDAGTYTADVTFTPDDAANYNSTSGTADVIVNMANPNVSLWPTASGITYGETLSASSLTGGTTDVPGTFSFDSPGTTPDAGTFTADVTFTPDDAANYNSTSGTADVIVNMANPNVFLWPTASGITYGETLSASSLTGGTADVPGTFAFDSPETTPNAGTYTADITFTPDDAANYNSTSGTADVIVNMANPNVSLWPTASDITYGETLSASSLTGGTADVPGTFAFDSPGTTPDAGTFTADVTFTPDDAANYNSTSGTADVVINKADQIITWEQDLNGLEVGNTIELTATSNSGLSVSYESNNPGIVTITGNQLEIIGTGSVTITASQAGNDNWNPAEDVNKAIDILVSVPRSSEENCNLYPNPAKTMMRISGVSNVRKYCIVNIKGETISAINTDSYDDIQIDVSNLVAGQYFLIITTGSGTFRKAFIVQ